MMHPMPTKNPRLTFTLSPSLAAQLRKLSELTGNSQSSLIGELLEGSGPVFDRTIQLLEAAKSAKQSMRGKITGDMEAAQAEIEGALGMVLEGFDQLTGSLLDEAEAVSRRGTRSPAPRGAAGPAAKRPTPISNRGVRFDPNAEKNRRKTPPPSLEKRSKKQVKKAGGVSDGQV